MKLDDLIALAKAGYKLKEIKALEEAEEKEKAKEEETKPEEATPETKPETPQENEPPDSGSDELAELKEKIEGFEREKEDLKKKLEEAQKEIRSRDHSGGESTETLDDIIKKFCED